MTLIYTILAAIFVLGPLIALHEWGHYIVARLCGVKVITYSIGFGPKLLSWTSKKTDINYCVSALPLGGYVKMLDSREVKVAEHEKHLDFNSQHPLKKIAIVLAGPLMNFLIAIVLFWVLFITPSEQYNTRIGSIVPNSFAQTAQMQAGDMISAIDGKPVNDWEAINYKLADYMGETKNITVTVTPYQGDTALNTTKNYPVAIKEFMQGDDKGKSPLAALGVAPWQPKIKPVVGQLSEDGAAIRQGMQVGDVITHINGTKINDWLSAVNMIQENPEKLLAFTVLRQGSAVELQIMPQGKKDDNGREVGFLGAGVKPVDIKVPESYKKMVVYDPITAIGKSFDKTGSMSWMTLKSMGKMLTGMIGIENISGPITIAKVAKQTFEISWQAVVSFAAIISVSLAVLNLLPIPVLDGGHMLYYLIELIRGKPLSEKTQLIGLNIGMLLMMSLMLLAITLDIGRLL
ncbi:RIP metalloprotease RseP [Psychrobacter sp. HD31]|uniref:RIP metalloprotease RseP n=1 Tax=Psychrobacter sp. HD31 TaxID=3112003 RepID=UPI003DA4129C